MVEIEIFDKFGSPVGDFKSGHLAVKPKPDFVEVPFGNDSVKIKKVNQQFFRLLDKLNFG